jgi:hypothetical protein
MLKNIEKFIEKHNIAPTTFGILSCGNPHIVRLLRQGKGWNSRTEEKIRKFIKSYKSHPKH